MEETGEQRSALDVIQRKNRRKTRKSLLQGVILLLVALLIYLAVFYANVYKEPDKSAWKSHQGFIALSYYGVSSDGSSKRMAKSDLNEQLKVLRDQGYRTISQQDVLDYYEKGKPLPDKALFLSFEDGRSDSSRLAEKMLERYNDKATFLTYANNIDEDNNAYLQPYVIDKMKKNGYWELGSSGYRLAYSNVFEQGGRFLGQLDAQQLQSQDDIRYYNYPLMDFIRDSNWVPTEDRGVMETRIAREYAQMKEVYTDKLGYVPDLYMIKHANTLQQSIPELVEHANEKNIEQLYKLGFAREGNAFNGSKGSVYDLTRLQPAPYWSTNHVMMRIGADTGQPMTFAEGEAGRAEDWKTAAGAAEFNGNEIVLTSPPGEAGLAYLRGSESFGDVALTAKLAGNVIGEQSIYLRYDIKNDSYVRLVLKDNWITVEQKEAGHPAERLFSRQLNDVSWRDADMDLSDKAIDTNVQGPAGAPVSKGIPFNVQHTREIGIDLLGCSLKLTVDGQTLLKGEGELIDDSIAKGDIALSAEASKLNVKDNIYDGRFQDVQLNLLEDGGKQMLLYRNTNQGFQAAASGIEHGYGAVVNWVVDMF
ncbi:polysaccharide deacetylase family protein [Paenibacillus sp. R14(2021)]|uniref:polysaccharide deacetylase family protein n=1 Tax=Paenibacillus sp. R14(2021) TaxID=2859228 RepID=UPI001C614F48|nr:polysaccharide deacetylase family protein [Paenibacillus sp. R14(2021)]